MKNKNYVLVLFVAVIIIIAIQIAIGVAVYNFLPDWPARGQFGDVFGVVNALFSGLAFSGLIYAILLQREDLSLQRKELELTRQELQRSASAQEKSESALKSQAESVAQSTKLNAINFLLGYYQGELTPLHGKILQKGDPRYERRQELLDKEQKLLNMLNSLFNEISQTKENNDTV